MNARIDELIALAALGELTVEEQAELDRACAADGNVAHELSEALRVAATMQGTQRLAPPPDLRGRVLDAIAATPQQTEAPAAPVAHVPPPPARAAVAPAGAGGPVVSLDERRRMRSPRWLAAAAAALVAAVGLTAVVVRSQPADDPIAAVVDADDAVERQLTGTLDGTLTVASSADEAAIVVVGDDLAAVPDDRTLQLWLIGEGDPVSVGTFAPDADGAVRVRFDGVDAAAAVLGVTVEPAGGSDAPTLPIVATA
jgi:anti-sigma-K factor RskA